MGTGGAGGSNGVVRPLQTQVDRQKTGNHVDDRTRHEERRDAPRPLFEQYLTGGLDVAQATDTGAHSHADALTVGVGNFQTGITHRLEAGRQTVLDEQIELARFLDRQVLLDVETFHRTADAGGEGRQIDALNQAYATAPGQNTLPAARHIDTQRRQHAHTGNHDASTRHCEILLFRLKPYRLLKSR